MSEETEKHSRYGGMDFAPIRIKKSATADTRSCDFANVSLDTLLEASEQHIDDVGLAMNEFSEYLDDASSIHDDDKIEALDHFHSDFIGGFKETGWWDRHRKIHRHHLAQGDGIPDDVNLMDILEYIADCVVAGKARTGNVYELNIDDTTLRNAFNNTVDKLKAAIVVEE